MTDVIPIQYNAFNAYSHHSYLAQCTIYHLSSVESAVEYVQMQWVLLQQMYDTWMTEMRKYGNKCFKCAKVQIGSSSDSWYQSPGLVAMARTPRGPVTLIRLFSIFLY